MKMRQRARIATDFGRRSDTDESDADTKASAPETESKSGSMLATSDDLKSVPLAEVKKRLGYSADGLTAADAEKRLVRYGPNEIEEKKSNPLLKFLTYFWGPIPWMIEVAVILSGVLRHWPDFFIILVLLVANGVVEFSEEHQAGRAIDALKAELAIEARVLRDGKWVNHAARELVSGDVTSRWSGPATSPPSDRAPQVACALIRSGIEVSVTPIRFFTSLLAPVSPIRFSMMYRKVPDVPISSQCAATGAKGHLVEHRGQLCRLRRGASRRRHPRGQGLSC